MERSYKLGVALAVTVALLGAAAPAAIAEGDYDNAPPFLKLTDEVKGPLIAALAKEGLDFADIEIVIVTDGQGRLVALHPEFEQARSFSVDQSKFVLPEVGTTFTSAAVIFENSPGKLVACGPPSPRICNAVP